MGLFERQLKTEADWPSKDANLGAKRRTALALSVIAVLMGIVALAIRLNSIQEPRLNAIINETYGAEAQKAETAAPPSGTGVEQFVMRAIEEGETARGNLILVNRAHLYQFDAEEDVLISLLDNTCEDYYVSGYEVKMTSEAARAADAVLTALKNQGLASGLLIDRAWRSEAEQRDIYERHYNLPSGEEMNLPQNEVLQVCVPGGSDYHTGLSLHLSVYGGGELDSLSNNDEIRNCMAEYGFVLRYPTAKENETCVKGNAGQFRYVGEIHAKMMHQNGWTLEAYIEALKQAEQDHKAVSMTLDGKTYTVYRISAEEGESIPVPSEICYELSGDNCGGMVVAFEQE